MVDLVARRPVTGLRRPETMVGRPLVVVIIVPGRPVSVVHRVSAVVVCKRSVAIRSNRVWRRLLFRDIIAKLLTVIIFRIFLIIHTGKSA